NCASKAQGFYEEGNELEGIQGGHARRLGELLRRHKEGEWVDPHEYEGLILHAIEYGKSSLSNKFYYMIEGVGAVNDRGETILTLDRLAHINSKHLTRFPLLEYVNAEVARGPNGEKRHRFTKDDYEHWCNIFDEGDPKNSKITKSVDDFLWEYVLPSNDTQNRINKVLRSAENLDHDDMYGYMPPATEGIVEELCKSTTGSKKFLTAEGYMNGLPGFSEYLRRTAQNDQKNKLREGIKSYIRFQGIITDDYKKGNESFFRTDRSMLNRASICSPTHSIVFLEQTTEVIKKVVDHYVNTYNNDELRDVADKIFNWKSGNMKLHEKEREKQYTIDEAYKKFGEVFDNAVQKDKGQAMKKIVEESNLLGMPTLVSDEEMQKRKKEAENSGKAGAIGDLDD
ncbi:hypothetical protein KJ632_00495, partial [Patescibacteria group bacterium]|nr:hypothetical protein [Patescibacteria group bacterium]